jgi:hypothetical protein
MPTFNQSVREHIVGILIAVAFGAWSLALFGTQAVVKQYLETQMRVEQKLEAINTTVVNGFAQRDRDLEVIRERQNANTAARHDQEIRLRALEKRE